MNKRFEANVCLSNPSYDLYVDPDQVAFGAGPGALAPPFEGSNCREGEFLDLLDIPTNTYNPTT